MTSSLNLGSLFGEIQCKLEKNITSMLNDVHLKNSEYKELHDNIMSLPAVAKLVAENKLLREKLAEYESESESRKICLEVVEKELPVNTKKIIYTNSGESMITDDLCNCDLCSNIVNCLKQNIFILTRGDDEEMVLCVECFEDHKMRLKTDHWKSDDFSEDDSSSDEEEEDEDDEEEEDKPSCNEEEFGMDIKEVEAIIEEESKPSCNEEEEESKPSCNEEDEPSCNEEDEDPDAFECDDCNVKDINCFEHLGISKDEIDIYRDLGEPDRCHDCFEKWKNSEDGSEYLKMVDGKDNEEPVKLCENMDCVRYPPDWDAEKDTEETYQEDPWLKCNQCDGYYNNDGGGDILYVQEEPNNQEAECDLCGKTKDIVQMKGTGQYLCGNACDESDEEEEEEEEEEEGKRKCETCAIHINTDDIIELSIEVNGHNLKLCLCENCFQDKADTLRKEGWNVDDFFEEEEEADASDAEASDADASEPEAEEEPSGEEEEEPSGEAEAEPSGEEASEAEEDDEEVEEIMIDKKMYYTTDIEHGSIYEDDDGDVGSKVGRFNNGNAEFY